MSKCTLFLVFVATALFFSHGRSESNDISTLCLGCLCEAVSNCNRTLGCQGNICGLFHITWGYWSDAGKPTNNNESPDSPNAFQNCVNEPYCAARAVQGYMAKFKQDCNEDGVINCWDYAQIHKFGGYGCKGNLPDPFKQKLEKCFSQLGGV